MRNRNHPSGLRLFVVVLFLVGIAHSTQRLKPVAAQAQETTLRVSVASDGTQGNAGSSTYKGHTVSTDGRYSVFESQADNLVESDTNGVSDVFMRDLQTQQTTRVSIASDGTEGDASSGGATITPDGRYILFLSTATNLVPNDTNGHRDLFVHDRETGETERVSISSSGAEANGEAITAAITPDGRYVAFSSMASNLTPQPVHGGGDVFLHDRQTSQTTQLSFAADGGTGNGYSSRPALSDDARYVAFLSDASNLVPGDTNGQLDTFVHDRQTGETTRVSVAADGTEGNDQSGDPAISADGRYIFFVSAASNLVPGDTNDQCPITGDPNPNCEDLFVRDQQTGGIVRLSVAPDGTEGNSTSGTLWAPPAISADGRFVAFWSWASNLVPDDTNEAGDLFLYDLGTAQTTLISVAADGSQSRTQSSLPTVSISPSGRVVAFDSDAPNLVAGDTNEITDVFVRTLGEAPPPTIVDPIPALPAPAPAEAAFQRGPVSILLVLSGLILLALAFRATRAGPRRGRQTEDKRIE